MSENQESSYYRIADLVDFDARVPGVPNVKFWGQKHEAELPGIYEWLFPTDRPVPDPQSEEMSAQNHEDVPYGARLTAQEAEEVTVASQEMVEEWQKANTALTVAEQAWLDAQARWTMRLMALAEKHRQTQELLSERVSEYQDLAWYSINARIRREAEVQQAAIRLRDEDLDRQYGPRKWVIMRHKAANGYYTHREDFPAAKRPDDLSPTIHENGCGATIAFKQPKRRDFPGEVDRHAPFERVLRDGALPARLPEVMEALREKTPPAYISGGRVWIDHYASGAPYRARFCRRCDPLSAIREAVGEDQWGEWCRRHDLQFLPMKR